MINKPRFLFAIVVLAMILSAFSTRSAKADVSYGPYIWTFSGYLADPVNLLFDINGSVSNSLTHVSHHLGWTDQGGQDMQFLDHSSWEGKDAQTASGCLPCNRYHQRYNQGADDGGPGWGTWTMGPVHYEVVIYCGHASTTYNGARDYVKNAFSGGGHTTGYVWKGNNAAISQCNGSQVAGDGYVAWLDID